MNIVKCANGHFYDADSYKKCPHCEHEIFSDDLSTVGTSADRLYDDKTFPLYSDREEEETLPSNMFGREDHYREDSESRDRDFFGKDYYPDDGEGTIPADYDGEGTIPMDGRVISSLSADAHHATDSKPTPSSEYDATIPSQIDLDDRDIPDYYGEGYGREEKGSDSFGDAYGREEKASDSFGGGFGSEKGTPDSYGGDFNKGDHSKLTISSSFNRSKPSSWPADHGEKSIDFEAEELHAGTDYTPLADAFHAANLEHSLSTDEGHADSEGLEAEEEPVSKPDSENLSDSVLEDEEEAIPVWDDVPEYDDEVIPAEEDFTDDIGYSGGEFGSEEIAPEEINSEEIDSEEINPVEIPSMEINPEEIEAEGKEPVEPDLEALDSEESNPEEIGLKEDDFNPFIIPELLSIEDGNQGDDAMDLEENGIDNSILEENDVDNHILVNDNMSVNLSEEATDESENPIREKSEEKAVTEDFDRTIIYEESDRRIAGWLVCVSGNQYGHSQEIMTGPNRISLWDDPDSMILTQHDEAETLDNAFITYDASSGRFRIQVGQSGLMIYVNDELVLIPRLLNDRDRISLGDSEYIFAAFCDDRFAWE